MTPPLLRVAVSFALTLTSFPRKAANLLYKLMQPPTTLQPAPFVTISIVAGDRVRSAYSCSRQAQITGRQSSYEPETSSLSTLQHSTHNCRGVHATTMAPSSRLTICNGMFNYAAAGSCFTVAWQLPCMVAATGCRHFGGKQLQLRNSCTSVSAAGSAKHTCAGNVCKCVIGKLLWFAAAAF